MSDPIALDRCGPGPRRGKVAREEPPRRTLLHEDGLHVATIVEFVDATSRGSRHGFCLWYVAGGGGRGSNYADAEQQIRQELQR